MANGRPLYHVYSGTQSTACYTWIMYLEHWVTCVTSYWHWSNNTLINKHLFKVHCLLTWKGISPLYMIGCQLSGSAHKNNYSNHCKAGRLHILLHFDINLGMRSYILHHVMLLCEHFLYIVSTVLKWRILLCMIKYITSYTWKVACQWGHKDMHYRVRKLINVETIYMARRHIALVKNYDDVT